MCDCSDHSHDHHEIPVYDAQAIETEVDEDLGTTRTSLPSIPILLSRRNTCLRCSRIPRATCTWAMHATTPSAMPWRARRACAL